MFVELLEKFEDVFKPATEDEVKDRSKPKEKKGDVVQGRHFLGSFSFMLLEDPRWRNYKGVSFGWVAKVRELADKKVLSF